MMLRTRYAICCTDRAYATRSPVLTWRMLLPARARADPQHLRARHADPVGGAGERAERGPGGAFGGAAGVRVLGLQTRCRASLPQERR
eukprot:3497783-Rhodomonas_salina.1